MAWLSRRPRDLSSTHAERDKKVVKKPDRFVDPIVVVRHGPREYWTPNGNQFEEAHFITLGLLDAKAPRFSGSVHAPLLRRVDTSLKRALPEAYEDIARVAVGAPA